MVVVNQKKESISFSDEMKGHYNDAGGFGSCGTPQSFRRLTGQRCVNERAINEAWSEEPGNLQL